MHCHHKHENFDLIIGHSPYSRGGKKLLGGKKLFTKFSLIEKLITKAEKLIVVGSIANSFLKAIGYNIGKSYSEHSLLLQMNKLYLF